MTLTRSSLGAFALVTAPFLFAACSGGDSGRDVVVYGTPSPLASQCAEDDGGLTLPEGFCAIVVHEGVGTARHIEVAENGDLFVAIRNRRDPETRSTVPGGVLVLRDSDGDGAADTEERWGENGGNDVVLHGGYAYFATDDAVLRYRVEAGAMTPTGEPDTIVADLPNVANHRAKSIAIADDGSLYVNIGSPSNVCMEESRTVGSPGKDPCDELETRAGIWRFDAETVGQTQADGTRFATGLRNTVALRLDPNTGNLYGAVHGRDQLHAMAEELFTVEESSENPGEEFVLLREGSDFGWPYCFYRYDNDTKVLGPEYGGDGVEVGRCADMNLPLLAFPGHWAPNDLEFNTGSQFPAEFAGGAFVAFHGSWNRSPTQQGYQVAFVPMADGRPSGDWLTFADGFAGGEIESPRAATHRPVGLSMGPDGSLYVSDSVEGKIWRILYAGGA